MTRVLVALALLAGVAHAQPDDAPPKPEQPTTVPRKPKLRRFYVRAGVAVIDPLSSSKPLELANLDGPATLALSNGPIAGSGATIGATWSPAIIIGYVLPKWHDRFAIETILGLPFTVKFQATGTLANQSLAPTVLGLPTGVMPLGSELGEAKAVPPVVTLVYALRTGAVKPYVGAGVAMLFATDAKITNPTLTMLSQPQFTIDPAPGVVAQAGIDVRIWSRVYARLDVKFIGLMQANATIHHLEVATPALPLFGAADVDTAKMSVWVNPLIVQLGVGTDF